MTLLSTLAPLVGRSDDLEKLCSQFTSHGHRITTLLGPVGAGKSRLARAAAEQLATAYAGEAQWVDLAPAADEASAHARAAALRAAAAESTEPCARRLLVVDNCEAFGPQLADILADVLLEQRAVEILATSRTPLGLEGERCFPVRPLATPCAADERSTERLAQVPSVALLLHYVTGFEPTFSLCDANRQAVAELCRQLDGLPLAIEYAAPRFKIHEPASLIDALGAGLGALTGGRRVPPWRHAGLREALLEHFRALPADAASLLVGLGRFEGGFTLEEAESVSAAAPVTVHRLLETLVDHQFVHRSEIRSRRFFLLRTTRNLLREMAQEADFAVLTARQHQVAELVALGMTNRAIARRLGISEWTAVNHVRQTMKKLNVCSRVEVASWVTRHHEPACQGRPPSAAASS